MSVLVGRKAPDFTVPAVLGNGEITDKLNLHDTIKGKYGLVFFYPLDFTFVCPSELIALDHRMHEFKERGVEVIAVSIDSQFTHNAYRNTAVKDGGIGPVKFALAADISHTICQSYGVEHPVAGVAFRGAFVIDKNGVVRSQIVNDLPIGRNVDEILRIIDAVQFFEEHGEVCPAGWQKGKAGMKASPKGVAEYLASHSDSL
ncbi:alkyl hydroperoxide reductase [Legionella taurinensis]|uniref:Thioredoxin peroxidase n=2 Tax=Legionella TaxID=445 RepID=A0A0W0XMB5_9GAMM|nr:MULTISPECIES: peroxiredoxin C [Legionella]KTD45786.1 alkyl hydroperoxide reductase [Legionella rubrilucens]MDX1836318.1 peroxiredoxin C [Legionella taurinensis]PUT41930.1 alkyl hydroperoxide reductase [Legionella taurinensis]PUT44719.1 alkyl hydroperoxide reductase [Legionella taurinensis]PUT48039.1 alkyl hydroperoxide reductase [Legionella taurinensis]